jgi:hypothetical protein
MRTSVEQRLRQTLIDANQYQTHLMSTYYLNNSKDNMNEFFVVDI